MVAPTQARSLAVIGGGPMGLAAAYEAARQGARVTVFEQADRLGGMSAHIDFDGTPVERYYHFICGPDETTFHYLREFGLEDRLKWRSTHMGFYYKGRMHDWGNPLSLLAFPHLSLWQKLRYGLHVLYAKRISDWRPFDGFSSTEWIQRWAGRHTYEVVWKRLFELKFYELQDCLSAAWIGTRIKRVALSRKSLSEERLGYLEGGSDALVQAAASRVESFGGRIRLKASVERVQVGTDAGQRRIQGVVVDGKLEPFDQIISTVPLPYLPALIPELPNDEAAKIRAIRNIGVVCVLLKLRRPFTRNFWTNINDPRIEIPGIIEYTNLNPLDGSTILYAPFYMPQNHPKWARDHQSFIDETLAALKLIRPDFDPAQEVLSATASRYQYAQTLCSPGFFDALPPMQSAIKGLFLADTSHYYPEDRSISESMRVGAQLAGLANAAA